MLKVPSLITKFAIGMVPWFWLGLAAGIFFAAATWNREACFRDETVYFVDGDCYARMNRVRELDRAGWRPVLYHAWENHPSGVWTHTTMPMDAGVFLLSRFFRGPEALSLAGAWVSPVLGLLLIGLLGAWLIPGRRPGWFVALLLAAVSPILAHGFSVGRPDHQSLLLLASGAAWIAQVEALRRRSARWHGVAGLLWALACWVSLFEPLILCAASGAFLVARALRSRVAGDWKNAGVEALVFGMVFAVWFFIDGRWPAAFPEGFDLWARTIGELRPAGMAGLTAWAGWFALLVPAGAWWSVRRGGGGVPAYLALMASGLGLAAFFQARWGYFFVLGVVMAMPFAGGLFRNRLVAAVVGVAGFWPIAAEWERMLYPPDKVREGRVENMAEASEVRQAALELAKRPPGAVAAPWWVCPAITWWSGFPCTAGTSHQSLPGTRATMAFFLEEDPMAAREFLESRGVRYVLACDPARVVGNAEEILGVQSTPCALAWRIFKDGNGFSPIAAGEWVRTFEIPAEIAPPATRSGMSFPVR